MEQTKDSCRGASADWLWACGSCNKDKHGKCAAQKNYEKRAACIAELKRLHV
jgi:hypothetical protein